MTGPSKYAHQFAFVTAMAAAYLQRNGYNPTVEQMDEWEQLWNKYYH